MSIFTKWSFKNKAAIMLITLIVLVMGVISYFRLPMEFLPEADQPMVSIVSIGPGSDAKTMESEVTIPIEQALAGVNGKTAIFSRTGDGFSQIMIHYEADTDMKAAKQEVQEALSFIHLPPNVQPPVISQLNTTMIPIVNMAITFQDGLTEENMELVQNEFRPLFQGIKGVASAEIFGVPDSNISVTIDNEKLTKLQIPFQAVLGVLHGQNVTLSVGEKIIDGKVSNIKVASDLDSLEKLAQLPVAPSLTLGDIAVIEETTNSGFISRFNGKDSLDVLITKEGNANAVSISKEIEKTIEQLNEKYPQQETTIYRSASHMVENSVHSMIKEVLLGSLFATIVIMIFLRNIRTTFITIVSIPLSLCLTLYLLSLSGITLNVLTLGGVAVAVGRLVDDSIVVIENIFRKMQKEKFSIQLIIDSTKQVGAAITASTLTTVAVFLPMGLLNGGLRQFLLPFALTITYSLLASLLVALTVVPVMSAGLLKNAKLPKDRPAVRFPKMLTWSLNHKWVIFSISILLFGGSIATYFMLPKGEIDYSSADYVVASISYPTDTPITEMKERTLELEQSIIQLDEVQHIFTEVGLSTEYAKYGEVGSSTVARLIILLHDTKNTDFLLEELEKKSSQFADTQYEVMTGSFFNGAGGTTITVDVVGDKLSDLEKTALAIKEKIEGIAGIEEVTTNQDEKKTIHTLVVDPAKGNTEVVAQQLGVMLNRTPIGTVNVNERQKVVYLEPLFNTETPEEIENIPIITDLGVVPVSTVAQLQTEESSSSQLHINGDPYIRVTASVEPAKLSEVSNEVQTAIFGDDGINIPEHVEVLFGGASVQQAEDFADLFLTMVASIFIVFLIMVITFKSIRAPLAILCSLPLAAIGAVLGIVISRISVDVTALLGALMLIGIVVTNAIVLIDRVKQNEEKMIIRDAIVEAATTRMRPIFMTAIATICAMLPLLIFQGEANLLVSQSLAIVVIGGLAMATLLTLIVVPCVYELLYFKKSKQQRLKQVAKLEIAN